MEKDDQPINNLDWSRVGGACMTRSVESVEEVIKYVPMVFVLLRWSGPEYKP